MSGTPRKSVPDLGHRHVVLYLEKIYPFFCHPATFFVAILVYGILVYFQDASPEASTIKSLEAVKNIVVFPFTLAAVVALSTELATRLLADRAAAADRYGRVAKYRGRDFFGPLFEGDIASCVTIECHILPVPPLRKHFAYSLVYILEFEKQLAAKLPYQLLVAPAISQGDTRRVGHLPSPIEPLADGTLTFDFQPMIYSDVSEKERDENSYAYGILATADVQWKEGTKKTYNPLPKPKLVDNSDPAEPKLDSPEMIEVFYGARDSPTKVLPIVRGQIPGEAIYVRFQIDNIPHPLARPWLVLSSPLRCKSLQVQCVIDSEGLASSVDLVFGGPARLVKRPGGEPADDSERELGDTETSIGRRWVVDDSSILTPGDPVYLNLSFKTQGDD